MIPNPDKPIEQILKPLSKITEGNKKQYTADVRVMKYLLQAIPNDIYNSVDACKNANDMWERIKRLMFGSDVTNQDGRVDIQTKKYFREQMLLAMKDEARTDDNAASDPSYDSNAVTWLGKNPERFKKAIAAQPKMYDGEMLHTTSLEIDSPDSEETLEDVEES
nr:hypothetical protein [Tanacetum cinerariifolium]